MIGIIPPGAGPPELALAMAAALLAGLVKGLVGFAMPMIMISALSGFLPAGTALAGLILPALVCNVWQAVRQGLGAALDSSRRFWRLLAALAGGIVVSAPLVPILPERALLIVLGGPILAFALSQLAGWHLSFAPVRQGRAEVLTGLIGGLFGGISGVWGPPVIALLLAMAAGKREMVRVQGVVYLIGSITLVPAHLASGVLSAATLPFSAALAVPALAGMALGLAVQDRIAPAPFRRATLLVLAIAALNLLRRGAGL